MLGQYHACSEHPFGAILSSTRSKVLVRMSTTLLPIARHITPKNERRMSNAQLEELFGCLKADRISTKHAACATSDRHSYAITRLVSLVPDGRNCRLNSTLHVDRFFRSDGVICFTNMKTTDKQHVGDTIP